MDQYALEYGHQPTANWILIVHPDNSSDFFTFEEPDEMWCCESRGAVRKLIDNELTAGAAI